MRAKAFLPLLLAFGIAPAHGDDGAASVAAGGLVLMKREPRITMAKEVLRIGGPKVVVAYDFRNDSDEDITTVVAFPVPRYGSDDRGDRDPALFDDFMLSVAGQRQPFTIESRAFVGKREVTALLRREHLDIATFGHRGADGRAQDWEHLSNISKQRLVAAGVVAAEAYGTAVPLWAVEKKYYWTQTFPARQTVHIEHSYSPVYGGTNSVGYGLEAEHEKHPDENAKYLVEEIQSLCLEPPLKKRLLDLSRRPDREVPFDYVDFILTTANTWKTPIEDFTLIVERPKPDKLIASKTTRGPSNEALVSFCWDGPVTKTGPDHFEAHLTGFVPKKELRVGFVSVDRIDP